MMRGARGLGFILAFLALTGFILAWATVPPPPVPYEVARWSGTGAAVSAPGGMIARDLASWQAIWRLAHPGTADMPPVPAFNPVTQVGVAVFLGTRPSAAYFPEIVSTAPHRRRFVIEAREAVRPGAAAMALTSPWEILLIRRPDLPVAIQLRTLPLPG